MRRNYIGLALCLILPGCLAGCTTSQRGNGEWGFRMANEFVILQRVSDTNPNEVASQDVEIKQYLLDLIREMKSEPEAEPPDAPANDEDVSP
jgi:hypothetical protein